MMNPEEDKRPGIEYPCEWEYKIIGTDVGKIVEAIELAAGDLEFEVTPSNISKKGRYVSLNFKLTVPNEVVRDIIYQKLNDNDYIKIVL